MSSFIKVLVVENEPIRRLGIIEALAPEKGFMVVGSIKDFFDEIMELPGPILIDVLVMNLDQFDPMKIRNWSILRMVYPEAQIVALTEGKNYENLEIAMAMGVISLLRTDVLPSQLRFALRCASIGKMFYEPVLLDRMKIALLESEVSTLEVQRYSPSTITKSPEFNDNKLLYLTPRERDVLTLLVKGKTNRQMGKALTISESTVEFHLSNIFHKFRVSSRTEAALIATRFIGNDSQW